MAASSAQVELLRHYDPAKGSFDPEEREPVQDRENNPRGVRHPFKTRQDHQPVSERERVKNAQRLFEARKKAGVC